MCINRSIFFGLLRMPRPTPFRRVARKIGSVLLLVFSGIIVGSMAACSSDPLTTRQPAQKQDTFELVGKLEDDRLVECSGLDRSNLSGDILWAINDGGNGPYLYALGHDGRHRGRLLVKGAQNRDWEGLDTFVWRGRAMILIADFGDNQRRHKTHTLYFVEEPRLAGESFPADATVDLAGTVAFSYPENGRFDAEGVATDPVAGKILVLTKRHDPPILFELPLPATWSHETIVARKIAAVAKIPPPSIEDQSFRYGKYRSQPTALDFSDDGRLAAVLTYKHAYLFRRHENAGWSTVMATVPDPIHLPLPQEFPQLRQREAICFSDDNRELIVTSEGMGAAIYRVSLHEVKSAPQ